MSKKNARNQDTKTNSKGGEKDMEERTVQITEKVSVKLTEAQASFYFEGELDGTKFEELVFAEFTERAEKISDNLDEEMLSLMGPWKRNLFRTVLRKWRAEHDTNVLRLEDIEMADLDKIAAKVDIRAHENNVVNIPVTIDKLVKQYKASRVSLAGVYNELTGRELKAVAFPRATSLHALRADVIAYLNDSE
jgi:hypothetical protein